MNKLVNKLGELEDVLEKYGIENLEEYISALIEARNFVIKEKNTNFSRYIKATVKNEELETELADLQHRLDVAEKALELAIETMRYELGRDAIKNLYKDAIKNLKENLNMKTDKEMSQWYLEQAESELKGE